jgi:hypothetical protein
MPMLEQLLKAPGRKGKASIVAFCFGALMGFLFAANGLLVPPLIPISITRTLSQKLSYYGTSKIPKFKVIYWLELKVETKVLF